MPRTTATQVANRDISCRITQCKESTEIAHIIPSSEMDRYRSQAMSRHADFNDASNAVLLRPDVHKIWDSKILPGNLLAVFSVPLRVRVFRSGHRKQYT
jgi:HNH endonuclease